jgi:hypothetical protein
MISAARGVTDRLPFSGAFRPTADVRVMFTKFFCHGLLEAAPQSDADLATIPQEKTYVISRNASASNRSTNASADLMNQ